jgi:hypothetical protein
MPPPPAHARPHNEPPFSARPPSITVYCSYRVVQRATPARKKPNPVRFQRTLTVSQWLVSLVRAAAIILPPPPSNLLPQSNQVSRPFTRSAIVERWCNAKVRAHRMVTTKAAGGGEARDGWGCRPVGGGALGSFWSYGGIKSTAVACCLEQSASKRSIINEISWAGLPCLKSSSGPS